ncbi:MAG: 50S ribosomal protein L11 methyltransferase [Bacteroidales bacterium]|jgi:ribosomal protein L11 methyltransferase|nr:50S ribosomal protein L11 methyltransferase [Bacteroidales bacterium]MCK9498018.1 50S ribosomal protein L11 methyltransferase [Bacteroidales bacterium]MDY0316055.1 50S ribosomal protein L11 methyltransferase [Bacteroidales bacterium]NLB86211.1 50S ribosomal protein L11 methyltransferase [Bacteroidales bacterium]
MNYIEVKADLKTKKSELGEILIAFLAEQGFESFSEENNFLYAYILETNFNKEDLEQLFENYDISYSIKIIPQQNWNKEWEKNFEPTIIEDILCIKAAFHDINCKTKHTIIIEPKMSFGTGHHATTWMMCKLIADYEFTNKSVLDYGCGTGILAIFSAILGSQNILAIDIDEWAYENTKENVSKNNTPQIKAIQGDVNSIPEQKFDFIFANINLNILKKDIPRLAKHLNNNGEIFFSGFLNNEFIQIEKVCLENGLSFVKEIQRDNWSACIFKKF